MGRDDEDAYKRRREREQDDEEEVSRRQQDAVKKGGNLGKSGGFDPNEIAAPAASSERLTQMIEQVPGLIEQVNNLYNMYFSGAEKRPPIERRKHLDQQMLSIQMTAKPTPAIQFRATNVMSTYNTHKDRWDKRLRELEIGKKR